MLTDNIKKGQSTIIDAASGERFRITDLLFELSLSQHSLWFLYVDNTIPDIRVLLSVYQNPHTTLVLLSRQLDTRLKNDLERSYQPDFVYDRSRDVMDGYRLHEVFASITVFARMQPVGKTIDPKIKLLLSTSGTTGSPKFVKLSDDNIRANAESIVAYLPIRETDVCPLNLPIYYSYGLSVLTSNTLAGATIVVNVADIVTKDFWGQFDQYGFSSFAGVPVVYEMLFRLKFNQKKYQSLRYFTQAGGKLNENLIRYFGTYAKEQGVDFFVMYGQTEATARMSYLPPADLLANMDCIGQAIPNGSFEIDPDTSELLYRGPNVFGGYCESAEGLTEYEHTSLLRTGDLAIRTDNGYYKITGRIKRFVKLFGNRINLDELEKFLQEKVHSGLYCIGSEDKELWVISDHSLNHQLIAELLKQLYKLHPSVIKTQTITSIPLTSNGKPDYRQMALFITHGTTN